MPSRAAVVAKLGLMLTKFGVEMHVAANPVIRQKVVCFGFGSSWKECKGVPVLLLKFTFLCRARWRIYTHIYMHTCVYILAHNFSGMYVHIDAMMHKMIAVIFLHMDTLLYRERFAQRFTQTCFCVNADM